MSSLPSFSSSFSSSKSPFSSQDLSMLSSTICSDLRVASYSCTISLTVFINDGLKLANALLNNASINSLDSDNVCTKLNFSLYAIAFLKIWIYSGKPIDEAVSILVEYTLYLFLLATNSLTTCKLYDAILSPIFALLSLFGYLLLLQICFTCSFPWESRKICFYIYYFFFICILYKSCYGQRSYI